MSWISENKFLSGFFAVLLIGAGVLGYLLYSAAGSFSEVSENYNKQSAELKRLQALTPYPDQANLIKLREQRDAYSATISDLQNALNAQEFPIQPMSQEQFQDRLRASVSQIVEEAKNVGVKMPDKFYMGFDNYQTSLPKPDAAAPLGRQLQAMEFVIHKLFAAKIDAVSGLTRNLLPEESAAPMAAKAPARGGPVAPPAKKLVTASTFQVSFTADQGHFRKWLNDVSSAKEQFYIVRLLSLRNDNPKPPPRAETAASESTPAPAQPVAVSLGVPGASPVVSPSQVGGLMKFIVGNEKVEVTARIDIADFTPAASPTAAVK